MSQGRAKRPPETHLHRPRIIVYQSNSDGDVAKMEQAPGLRQRVVEHEAHLINT